MRAARTCPPLQYRCVHTHRVRYRKVVEVRVYLERVVGLANPVRRYYQR